MVKLAPTQFVALPLTVAVGVATTVTVLVQVAVQPLPSVIVLVRVNDPTADPAVTVRVCRSLRPLIVTLVETVQAYVLMPAVAE